MCPADDSNPSLRSVPPHEETDERPPREQLHAEQFDILMQELVPQVRELSPTLSDVEVLRLAAQLAEDRLREGGTLSIGLVDVREIENDDVGDAVRSDERSTTQAADTPESKR